MTCTPAGQYVTEPSERGEISTAPNTHWLAALPPRCVRDAAPYDLHIP